MHLAFVNRMGHAHQFNLVTLMACGFTGGALFGLTACAPNIQQAPAISASTPFSKASFYPDETGLQWRYLKDGDQPSAVPYRLKALGPTVFKGVPVKAIQLTGRGAMQTWYRQSDQNGVRLLGITKPGVTITLDPPWQEYPATKAWKVGLTWQGNSKIKVLGDDHKVHGEGTLNYRYDVQDQRKVKTPAGEFSVYVITRQIKDDVGGLFPSTQQLWFTPYIGEVKTPEGLLLTGRNFMRKETQP